MASTNLRTSAIVPIIDRLKIARNDPDGAGLAAFRDHDFHSDSSSAIASSTVLRFRRQHPSLPYRGDRFAR